MSSVAKHNNHGQGTRLHSAELKVSAYDRVSSLLIALLILVGFFVFLMFVIWLTSTITLSTRAVPVTLIEEGGGGGAQGEVSELEEPLEMEVIELTEIEPVETLKEIKDVSAQVAALDVVQGDPNSQGEGSGTGDGTGPGSGGGDGANMIPRHERWVIRFESTTVDGYAQQLDAFGIELGFVRLDSPRIDYARNLANARADVRSGTRQQEKRLYFRPQEGVVANWTNQLLSSKAGINLSNGLAHLFFSAKVENDLALLERDAAGERDPREYKRTVFGVKTEGSRMEFFVISQQFRPIPR